MRAFTFYEFAGFIAPGTLVLAGIAFIFPAVREALFLKDISVGNLGLFTVLSYVVGHLVQALGNVMESLWWWIMGGVPTDWVRTGKRGLLSKPQLDLLRTRLASVLGIKDGFQMKEISSDDWYAITRQARVVVTKEADIEQLEAFNGNYGLNRGLAAALLVIAAGIVIRDLGHWEAALFSMAGALVALLRMHRFAQHYARELFVQFLSYNRK